MKEIDKDNNKIKKCFIKQIKSQLDYDGLMNLTQWFKDNSHHDYHHWGYVRSIAYRMERLGLATVLPEDDWMNKPEPKFWIMHSKWSDRHPYLHQLLNTIIASIFSLTVALLVLQIKERRQDIIDEKQNLYLKNLDSTLQKVQRELKTTQEELAKSKKLQRFNAFAATGGFAKGGLLLLSIGCWISD